MHVDLPLIAAHHPLHRPSGSRGQVEQQMRELGFSPSVHAWIMSSLKTTAQGSEFAFDLDGISPLV